MVLDPFSTLGLAGNIIHHSQHLLGITALINEASADGAAAVGPHLIGLCNNCGDIANTIQQALEDLKAKEERTRWKSFVQAMKQSGRTGQFVDLSKKIEKLQGLLNLHLVVLITKKQSHVSQQLESLAAESRRLNMDRTKDLQFLKSEVIDALNSLDKKASLPKTSIDKHMSKISWQKPLICYVYLDLDGMHYQSDYEPWSFTEPQESVQLLRQQQDASVRFCFFIDGLDKYDAESTGGTHAGLVRSLKTLAESPDIKLCVSSRPWTVFMDAFGRNPERMLALEDLNCGDIYSYVSSTFSQNQRFVELESQNRRYHELIEEIVEKARGVFLWVFLVVRSLESGLEHSDRISDLRRRLRLLPRNLKALFRQILGNMDEVYQQQAAELFKMMLDTSSPISLMTLSLADEEDVDFAFKPHQPLTTVQIRDRQEIMRRRLDARCKGLVEVTKLPTQHSANGSHYFFSMKIDFLHRTVRDFLKNKEMEDFFERFTQDFNSHLVLAKSFLAQMKNTRCVWKLKHILDSWHSADLHDIWRDGSNLVQVT
ncbi:hypothetical protein GTA08_BOTSDO00369 [Botryosphaeria dothidea]|uniref:DUF7791 domain-containing protein n=1 Tax=Botryosphaeria dothidea TaxID=55169 RepID=A0A8H4J6D2_9PEZI|nr:hypothetical protein GTA08_BOTSDO00369 [Botryosphaeria dothidea]